MGKIIKLEQRWGSICDNLESVAYGDVKNVSSRWEDYKTRHDYYKIVSPLVIVKNEDECNDVVTYKIYCNSDDYSREDISKELSKGFNFLIGEIKKGRLGYGDDVVIYYGCDLGRNELINIIDGINVDDEKYYFYTYPEDNILYGDVENIGYRGTDDYYRYYNILSSTIALSEMKPITDSPIYRIFTRPNIKTDELAEVVRNLKEKNADRVDVFVAKNEKQILKSLLSL